MKYPIMAAPRISRTHRDQSMKQPRFWFHLPLLLLCMMGPMANFGNTSFSVLNLSSILVGPFLLARLSKNRASRPAILTIAGFVLILFLSFITLLTDTPESGIQYVRDIATSLFCFVLAIFWLRYFRDRIIDAISVITLILFVIAILQFTFELFGFGIDPNLSKEFYTHAGSAYEIGYPSVFGNPNNFSAFVLPILIIFIVEKKILGNLFLILICLVSLVLAGSRMSFFGAFVGLFFWRGHTRLAVVLLVFIAFTFLVTIYNSGIKTDIYAVDKVFEAFRMVPSGLSIDNSIGIRILSHQLFLENFSQFVLGSFAPSHMCPQLSGLSYYSNLMEYSPHSMIIELHCLFGAAGTVAMSFFIMSIITLFSAKQTPTTKIFLIVLIVLVVITLPSNIFRASQLFFSLTVFIVVVATNWKGYPSSKHLGTSTNPRHRRHNLIQSA